MTARTELTAVKKMQREAAQVTKALAKLRKNLEKVKTKTTTRN